MNRLQRKCLLASAGLHLLLLVTLLLGSAFRARTSRSNDTARDGQAVTSAIQLLPSPQLEASMLAQSPAAVSQPVSAPRQVQASPALRRNQESLEAGGESKLKLPQISTNLVMRNVGSQKIPRRLPSEDTRVEQFDQVVQGIFAGLSSGTPISVDFGAGQSGGEPSYAQIVREAYTRSWDPTAAGVTSEQGTTTVTITIARDGKVLSAQIIKLSGDPVQDSSVRRALDRVRSIEAFEKGAKEKQRTYTIHFNLNRH